MSFLERHLTDPVRFARIKRWFYGCLLVVILAEIVQWLVFHDDHGKVPFESWPAFGSLYGFASCAAIIVVSKIIGKLLVRREDYYD